MTSAAPPELSLVKALEGIRSVPHLRSYLYGAAGHFFEIPSEAPRIARLILDQAPAAKERKARLLRGLLRSVGNMSPDRFSDISNVALRMRTVTAPRRSWSTESSFVQIPKVITPIELADLLGRRSVTQAFNRVQGANPTAIDRSIVRQIHDGLVSSDMVRPELRAAWDSFNNALGYAREQIMVAPERRADTDFSQQSELPQARRLVVEALGFNPKTFGVVAPGLS